METGTLTDASQRSTTYLLTLSKGHVTAYFLHPTKREVLLAFQLIRDSIIITITTISE